MLPDIDEGFLNDVFGVRVIPQSLDALWEALTAELARNGTRREKGARGQG